MKLCILNDLHNEFEPFQVNNCANFDVLILAGDIDLGIKGAKWALENYKDLPIIYVTGNHEYYGKKIPKINSELVELSRNTNLYFLENDEFIYENTRFLGCTLWTDYNLYGSDNTQFAIYEAQNIMTDYYRIRLGSEQGYRKLKPTDTIYFHRKSVKYLEKKLNETFDGSTVIITHHSPSPKSISGQYKNDLISAAFCSNLEWLINKYKPKLWVHGHIHETYDYTIGDTRIICNSRGYAPDDIVKDFQMNFIIEL